jgi:hypothetical protein
MPGRMNALGSTPSRVISLQKVHFIEEYCMLIITKEKLQTMNTHFFEGKTKSY